MICTDASHQRISFSSDLDQADKAPPPPQPVIESSALIRRDESLLNSSTSEFEFNISNNFDPGDSSPADEIFADGMILPFHVTPASTAPKRLYKYELPPITSSLPPSPLSPPQQQQPLPTKHSEKETTGGASSDSEAEKSSKSFWSFRRSSSLNCDLKKSLMCSFPRLTRSNSTGSVTNSKRAMLRDVNNHDTSSSSSICCNAYKFRPQKNSGKKGEGGGSFSVIPVLNGPSTFGLGSIVHRLKGKKKKNKK